MKKVLISTVASMMLAGTAMAGGDIAPVETPVVAPAPVGGFYAGLGVASNKASWNNGSDTVTNYTLIGGYEFNDYLAVEGRFTDTMSGKNDIDYVTGGSVFLKPQYPVFDAMKVYALVGVGYTKIFAANNSTVAKGNDFQWGLGASYDVMDNMAVFVDYTSLATGIETLTGLKDDDEAWTFGVNYKF